MKSLSILPFCLAAAALPVLLTGCNRNADMGSTTSADTNAPAAASTDTNMAPAAAPMTPAPAATDTTTATPPAAPDTTTATPPAAPMDTNAPASTPLPTTTTNSGT